MDSPTKLGPAGVMWAGMEAARQERERGGARTLLWIHDVGDGRRAFLYAMAFGNVRLCVGPADSLTYDDGYCYAGEAVAAWHAATWIADGAQGEPDGWKKNLQTGEYREESA